MLVQSTQEIRLTDKEFREVSKLVYDHCGINLHEGKKELVRARLAKRLREGRFKSFREYFNYVTTDKSGVEFSILIDTITTNLTSFFRETHHFKFLEKEFLPALMARKQKKGDSRIRIWSAGCSSGEEPYSIAITVNEALENCGSWDAKILATDISTRMLDRAKQGIYNSSRVAPIGGMQKTKYLTSSRVRGERIYQVNDNLRQKIMFRYLNLGESWPIRGPIDVIFCRNVMIYFDKQTQEKLVNRFWDLLDSGGVLFTGHSESLTGIQHKYKYVKPTVYMKP